MCSWQEGVGLCRVVEKVSRSLAREHACYPRALYKNYQNNLRLAHKLGQPISVLI